MVLKRTPYEARSNLYWSRFSLSRIDLVRSFPNASKFKKNLIWCFVCCFTLFNLQGTRSLPLSRTAYIYYHKLCSLSTPFFNFFQIRSGRRKSITWCRSKQAWLLYIAELDLSSTFFLRSAHPLGPGAVNRSALKWAWLIYYTESRKSTPFFPIFRIFCKHFPVSHIVWFFFLSEH